MSMFEVEVEVRDRFVVDAVARDSLVKGSTALVSIVDDDLSVRESLPDLLRQFGYAVEAFSSAEEFLASDVIDQTRCLLLDVTMPGMGGLQARQELSHRRQRIPIVFITASGDGNLRPFLL